MDLRDLPQTNEQFSPKTAQKRLDILANSLRVFAQEGYGGTDVQVIADLAGVGKGTVYRHFGNKQKLFMATAKHCLDMLDEFVIEQLGGRDAIETLTEQLGAIETLRRIASAVALYYQHTPQAVEIMIQERAEFRETVFPTHLKHRADNRAGVDELIKAAIASGEICNFDPNSVTNAYADLIYGSVISGCLEGCKMQLVRRVDAAIDIFLAGLSQTAQTSPHTKARR